MRRHKIDQGDKLNGLPVERKHVSNQPKRGYAEREHDAARYNATGSDAINDANAHMWTDGQHKDTDTAADANARSRNAGTDSGNAASFAWYRYAIDGAKPVLYSRFLKKLYWLQYEGGIFDWHDRRAC